MKTAMKIALIIVAFGFAFFAFLPIQGGERRAAPKSRAIARAKEIATGAILYAADYDDRFPLFTYNDQMANKISPYFPKTGYDGIHLSYQGEAATYVWNHDLSGYHQTPETNTRSWMFYNPEVFKGKKVLAYVDSSVRSLTPDELQQSLAVRLKP